MLSGLVFETPAPPLAVSPDRTDIACFIGYVARRPGAALPADVIAGLKVGGWVDGPWAMSAAQIDALEQVPVAFESWQSFARLFAWEQRPLQVAADGRCATYLGAAVRSFFASGGRRAWVIRVADPFPYLETAGGRAANRGTRLQRLIPGYFAAGLPAQPLDIGDPGSWHGIHHLCGLPEPSHLCLPDLPDICARDPSSPSVDVIPPSSTEVFVECSGNEQALPTDQGLRQLASPRSDADGYAAWQKAVNQIRRFLGGSGVGRRRDVLFIGALPLPQSATATDADGIIDAEADLLAFLHATGVLERDSTDTAESNDASAFLQLAWPWLRTSRSDDLPQFLEPADGLLAGCLASNALLRGTFRSVAGTVLDDVIGLTPLPAMGLGADSPTDRLAARICLIGQEPDGMTIESDVTTVADTQLAWRFGGTSRLMASILRAARRFGEAHLFEPNGPVLWTNLKRSMEAMLSAFWREGAFAGASEAEAYQVHCDRSTMNQNDLDNGRLVAEITVRPAAAIVRITVVFDMMVGSAGSADIREVA
jgi:hypothetical protein